MAQPARIEIEVDVRRPKSRVLDPSVMASFALPAACARFLSLPRIGFVRLSYGWALRRSRSREEFLAHARSTFDSEVKPFLDRGATVLAQFDGIPRWNAAAPQDASITPGSGWQSYARGLPIDPEAHAALIAEVAELGSDELIVEFSNEPSLEVFNTGDLAGLFELGALVVRAVHAKGKRVVGLANASWNDPRQGDTADTRPVLQRWIEAMPEDTDGVSWHCFQRRPSEGIEGAERVRGWLRRRGLPLALPQYVTEWQRCMSWPLDPSRDLPVAAAHHAATLRALDRAGITGATVCTLEGFERPAPLGTGTFGLLTHDGAQLIEKPTFGLQRSLAALGPVELGVRIPPELVRAGVDVIATDNGSRREGVRVLVWRFDEAGKGVVPAQVRWRGQRRAIDLEPAAVHLLE